MIVVSAFEEGNSQGSLTFFRSENGNYVQMGDKLTPPNGLCEVPRMGYTVICSRCRWIAA